MNERRREGERVVAAMSGGVDSSVAALLLKEAGCDVVGLFLRNGVKAPAAEGGGGGGAVGDDAGPPVRRPRQGCCSAEDAADARRVADRLGIPFYALDYEEAFDSLIADFVRDYADGRTPSPCVLCNQRLKFGKLLEFAGAIGAAAVATGHYARVEAPPGPGGRFRLRRARDASKDQTYFLCGLGQAQLARARFPVGGLTKPEVRAIARRAGLPVAEKPESMEICFVPGGDYRAVVAERAPAALRAGEVVDEAGRVLGRHGGIAGFTVGQRRGLGVALGRPAYVLRIEPAANRLVVGDRGSLYRRELEAERLIWIDREAPDPGDGPLRLEARIRHNHRPAAATVRAGADGRARVVFDEPQLAVAPGQAVVLYDGEIVVAGGFIGR